MRPTHDNPSVVYHRITTPDKPALSAVHSHAAPRKVKHPRAAALRLGRRLGVTLEYGASGCSGYTIELEAPDGYQWEPGGPHVLVEDSMFAMVGGPGADWVATVNEQWQGALEHLRDADRYGFTACPADCDCRLPEDAE